MDFLLVFQLLILAASMSFSMTHEVHGENNDQGLRDQSFQIHIRRGTPNQTYIVSDGGFTFQESKNWCDYLGGQLPIVKYQNDLDFLMKVIGKFNRNRKIQIYDTWMGREPFSYSQCSDKWLDASPLTYTQAIKGNCSACNKPCCAMTVANDESEFAQMFFAECHEKIRKVCIVQGDWMQTKLIKDKSGSQMSRLTKQVVILLIVVFYIALVMTVAIMRKIWRAFRKSPTWPQPLPTSIRFSKDEVSLYQRGFVNNVYERFSADKA
jgi:hypothetical protein